MAHKLVIGNKNASSWSLRPWLAMRRLGIRFEEVNIDLCAPDAKAQMLEAPICPTSRPTAMMARRRPTWTPSSGCRRSPNGRAAGQEVEAAKLNGKSQAGRKPR
jgi:hypothetical protein